jgi:hypothetical protein
MRVINKIALGFLSILFCFLSIADIPFKDKAKLKKLERLHDSISMLNLVNGLNLSEKQLRGLLLINKKIKSEEENTFNSSEFNNLKKKKEEAFEKLYRFLKDNPDSENKMLQQKAQKANLDLKDYLQKEAASAKDVLNASAKKARKILTSEQLQVIDSFSPCIVPPDDMRDPVRAGQASQGDENVVKILDRIRKVKNSRVLDAAAEKIADRIIDGTNSHIYKMTLRETAERKTEIIDLIKKVNTLNDTEWVLERDKILKKLMPDKDKLKNMYKSIEKRNPHTISIDGLSNGRIIQYLLQPDIAIPILESRLSAQRKGGLK